MASAAPAAAAGAGIYCIVQAFQGRHLDETMFSIGFPCVLADLFAAVAAPWLMPAKIEVTRDGMLWGGTRYPRQQIVGGASDRDGGADQSLSAQAELVDRDLARERQAAAAAAR